MKKTLCLRIILAGALLLLLGGPAPATAQGQPLVSMNVRDADLVDTLQNLAEIAGLNLIIGSDVRGTVTLQVKDVPVGDAFEIVVKTAGLAQVRQGSVIGILPQNTLLKQRRQEAEAHALGQARFRIEVVTLRYAKATELAPILSALLSPWGTIAVDRRTNSLVIRDVPESSVFQRIQTDG